jgi:hypothetical protein
VQFATIAALQQLHPEVDIHLGSCESLRPRVPEGVTFHPIVGRGMSSYYDLKTTDPVKIKRSWTMSPRGLPCPGSLKVARRS